MKLPLLLVILLVFFSGCSITISQSISKDNQIPTTIDIKDIETSQEYCGKIQKVSSNPVVECLQDENSIHIEMIIYPSQETLYQKDSLFTTKTYYDPQSILEILNDVARYENSEFAIFTENKLENYPELSSGVVEINFPDNIEKSSYSFEDKTISTTLFQLSQKDKTVTTSSPKYLVILGVFILVIGSGVSIYFYFREPQGQSKYIQTFNPEEEKAKHYIQTYKTTYSKEILFQGLVQSGIESNNAQKYLQKYF